MLNSTTFLDEFAELEKWLRKVTNSGKDISFVAMVDKASKSNPAVKANMDSLKEFADLRNAIVHERTDSHVIAEPNDQAVVEFRRISQLVRKPPQLLSLIHQGGVICCRLGDQIGDALRSMHEGAFSQLPILNDDKVVVDVLTAETIARWLASEVSNDSISLRETKIEDVLKHKEKRSRYVFKSRDASVYDVLGVFEEYLDKGLDVDAILITQDGRPNQSLLRILTIYDVPELRRALGA